MRISIGKQYGTDEELKEYRKELAKFCLEAPHYIDIIERAHVLCLAKKSSDNKISLIEFSNNNGDFKLYAYCFRTKDGDIDEESIKSILKLLGFKYGEIDLKSESGWFDHTFVKSIEKSEYVN